MKTQIGSKLNITSVGCWLVAWAAMICQAQTPTADSFDPGANNTVSSLAVQADGKILVGGLFTSLGGQTRNRIARVNSDGTLDSTLDPGADNWVESITILADGKILVGGRFTTLGGQTRPNIGRLHTNGILDIAFNPGANSTVRSVAVQADGKMILGGDFSIVGGQTRQGICRINSDGTLDTAFNPGAGGSYPYVYVVAMQADGKLLVGGEFTVMGGQLRDRIARLNSNGGLDTAFNPGAGLTSPWTRHHVAALVAQADGKILVGGDFTTLGGQTRSSIGRLNSDGTLDINFNPGASGSVPALAVQADGRIVAGGTFDALGGQPRSCIGRLNNTEPATESLSYDGSSVSWLRGGTSPEAWRTSFDASTNGGNSWFSLGEGIRMSGGWQLSSISLVTTANIRARGFLQGGQYNGSGWFVESIIGPAAVQAHPVSRTNILGTTATFHVVAGGSPPFSYHWLKSGVPMSDGGSHSGVTTSTLTMSNVWGGDAGEYSAIVSNAFGSVTSQVAVLTVIDLAQGVDTADLTWTSGGFATWFVHSTVTHDGVDALRCGTIADSQESWVQTTVTGPGTLAFWWKVSSEMDYDALDFSIDGVVQSRISGEEDWGQLSMVIPAGSHMLGWRYDKDASTSLGQDAAWLDEVVFVPNSGPPVVLAQPPNQMVGYADSVTFPVGVGGGTPRTYRWVHNESAINGGTNVSLTFSNVALSAAGNYYLVVSNAWGITASSNAVLMVTTNGRVTNVLLFVDNAAGSPYRAALVNLGVGFQQFTDHGPFNAAVKNADVSETLVIVDSHSASHAFNAVGKFARAGGRVLFQYWGLNTNSTMVESFHASVARVFTWPAGYSFHVHPWNDALFFSGLTNGVLFAGDLVYDGQKLQPTAAGQAAAGFTSSPTVNEAAIVVGHAGRTVLNGCLLEESLDASTGVRLAQNQIAYLLAVRTPRLFSPSWSDGLFQVSMEGTPGQTYSLRSSGDFFHWNTVTNVTLSTNPVTITVPAPADRSFYQMVAPPVP